MTKARLDSWKAVAEYLQRSVRTVQRWQANNGLPVHRVPGMNGSSVYAFAVELDAWLKRSDEDQRVPSDHSVGATIVAPTSKARKLWECRSADNLDHIIKLSRSAIRDNPHDAEAYGILANAYLSAARMDLLPPSYAYLRAKKAAEKALNCNRREKRALCAGAWLLMLAEHDWLSAELLLRDVLSSPPDLASACLGLANICLLQSRFEEADSLVERACKAEPLSPSVSASVARLLYCKGEFNQAATRAEMAITMGDDSAILRGVAGLAYLLLGWVEWAVQELTEAAKLYPASPIIQGALGHAYAMSDREIEARQVLSRLEAQHAHGKVCCGYALALVSMGLMDMDGAMGWLEAAYRNRSVWIPTLSLDGMFVALRKSYRFKNLLEKIRVPVVSADWHESATASAAEGKH